MDKEIKSSDKKRIKSHKKNCIELKSNAKINLSLDVLGKLPDGYHEVRMVMQLLKLHDKVSVGIFEDEDSEIKLSTNLPYIPRDERNLAYKAAMLMKKKFPEHEGDHIRIAIKKNIPVAAGLAGGSGNGAAVILALNKLWGLNLSLKEMIDLSKPLGSDVPFMVMGGAAANDKLGYADDPLASTCCEAGGKGDEIMPLPGFSAYAVLSKPPISISTAKIYQALKIEDIDIHPDIDEMIEGLIEKNQFKVKKNMINVLENVTLKEYPLVEYTKNKMEKLYHKSKPVMSGSGPTVYGLYPNKERAKAVFSIMEKINAETYLTGTLGASDRRNKLDKF